MTNLIDKFLDQPVPFRVLIHSSVLTVWGFVELILELHQLLQFLDEVNAVPRVGHFPVHHSLDHEGRLLQ